MNFIQNNQQQITNYLTIAVQQTKSYLSGTSTTDEPTAEASRVSGAPTEEDPQGVPSAPQLSVTSDPLPATDPAIAYSQEQSGTINTNGLLYPSDDEILETLAESVLDSPRTLSMSDLSELDQLMQGVETILRARYCLRIGFDDNPVYRHWKKNLNLLNNQSWVGHLLA